jgi:hypothetical protein
MLLPFVRRIPFMTMLALGAVGCGGSNAKVEGTVTYQGRPLVLGSVMLFANNDASRVGGINSDGTFSVEGLSAGTYRIAVTSVERKKKKKLQRTNTGEPISEEPSSNSDEGKTAASTPGWFPIPERYGNVDESGLSVSVGKGTLQFDIKLTD